MNLPVIVEAHRAPGEHGRQVSHNNMRNPIRRNRNIGKTQGGRITNGRPEEKLSRIFTQDIWTKLSENNEKWRVFRENPSRNFYHPCDADDYITVLSSLPDHLTDHVKAIVLRRTSKRDERLMIDARRRYYCVIMNAFPKSNEMIWRKKPSAATVHHFAPWCENWIELRDMIKLIWTPEEVRRYYMYHVFLHEVGHINQPWFHKARRREEFAENFAFEWAEKLGQLKRIHRDT